MRLRSLSNGSSRTTWCDGGDRLLRQPALRGEREQRALGRIADDVPALPSVELERARCCRARRSRRGSRAVGGLLGDGLRRRGLRAAPAGRSPCRSPCSETRRVDLAHGHLVLRERAGLVGADDVAAPSVSTAASLRTIAPRFAMRCMPSASVIVVIAGSPSGIAATARLTASSRSSCQARSAVGHAPARTERAEREARPEDALAEVIEPLLERRLLVARAERSSRRCLPSSVCAPVATTSARPLPRTTVVPGEEHRRAVADRRVVGERARASFAGRRALAGERRLLGARD